MTEWNLTSAAVYPVAVPALLYVTGRVRIHRRQVHWPLGRDLGFAVGLMSVAIALVSPLAAADGHFVVHSVQHLLLAMAAPIGFALAAPVTLLLRASPVRSRRTVLRLLGSPVVRWLSWAPVGAVLSIGSMWLLYLTPLYAATLTDPLLHDVVHLHMLLVGCLLTAALIGPDPIPGRGGWAVRIGAVVAVMAAHDILAKYLYIHAVELTAPSAALGSPLSWQLGAQVLWYGGDLLTLVVVVLLFHRWYAATGRQLARDRRRAAYSGDAVDH